MKLASELYTKQVEPVMRRKCFDCHSNQTHFPWYHQIPGIKQLLDHDVTEGKKHINMQNGFPFESHASPEEDLKAMREAMEEGDMPPILYKMMHPDLRLSEEEKKAILDWVEASEKWLKENHK